MGAPTAQSEPSNAVAVASRLTLVEGQVQIMFNNDEERDAEVARLLAINTEDAMIEELVKIVKILDRRTIDISIVGPLSL